MALERYNKPGVVRSLARVSIWPKGQISFNKALVAGHNLEQYRKVILYFDKEAKHMVFEFTSDMEEVGTCNVGYTKMQVGLLSAKLFLDYFGIDHSVSMKYPAHFDEATRRLTVVLSEGMLTDNKRNNKTKEASEVETTTVTPINSVQTGQPSPSTASTPTI